MMNADYVQNLRYKLQKRFRRVNAADWQSYHFSLQQFWDFLRSQPVLMGILEDVERRSTAYEEDATSILAEHMHQALFAESEAEALGFSYLITKECAESSHLPNEHLELMVGHKYAMSGQNEEAITKFTTHFVEPLYEYVDEQLDDQRAILSLLRRYKHKCEWFQRQRLYEMWDADRGRGEKTLALHLYEYLHDQGIDFHIEPASASGEVDIISAQKSDDPLLADAKIFNPAGGQDKGYLAKGVGQIYRYAVDYNDPFGYLVIYKTCSDDLALTLTNQSAATPFLVHNNKTIFLVVVDIYPHKKSASRRGRLKPIEITEDDLIKIVEASKA